MENQNPSATDIVGKDELRKIPRKDFDLWAKQYIDYASSLPKWTDPAVLDAASEQVRLIQEEIARRADIRTAEQMIEYCQDFNTGQGSMQSWDFKHFKLIEESLLQGETVLVAFEGLHNYKSMTKHDKNFAYALTNKRIIMAQKRLVGSVVQSVSIEQINDITINRGFVFGVMTIDTVREVFNVCVGKEQVKVIHDLIHQTLEKLKKEKQSRDEERSKKTESTSAEGISAQMIELKKLLDMGIITQDDFDAKKRKILGI